MVRRSRNHFRLIQKKRYEARRFHNPYFQHLPKRNWKVILIVGASVAAFITLTSMLFGSSYFAIRSVSVTGTETVSPDELSAKAWEQLNTRHWLFFRSSNRFLFNEERLRETLSSAYSFETLSIDHSCEWGGGCALDITVTEKTSQLLWISNDRVALADLNGVLIRELTQEEFDAWNAPEPVLEPLPDGTMPTPPPPHPLKRLPVFEDVNGVPAAIGSSVLTSAETANTLRLHQGLATMGITQLRTKIDRLAGKWMAVKTSVGYEILFDASGDIEAQLTNLQVLLRDTVSDTAPLQYIDLRFGDHVYYK